MIAKALIDHKTRTIYIHGVENKLVLRNFDTPSQPAKMNLNKKSLPKHWSVQTMIFGP